jgi:hypothetical protein
MDEGAVPTWRSGDGARYTGVVRRIGASRPIWFGVEVSAPSESIGRYRISITPGGVGRWIPYEGDLDRGCEVAWKGLQVLLQALESALPSRMTAS